MVCAGEGWKCGQKHIQKYQGSSSLARVACRQLSKVFSYSHLIAFRRKEVCKLIEVREMLRYFEDPPRHMWRDAHVVTVA
jgi:hypothetical protein